MNNRCPIQSLFQISPSVMIAGVALSIDFHFLFHFRIVDTTIRDAVKEHLFGGELVTSSSESDTQVCERMSELLLFLSSKKINFLRR